MDHRVTVTICGNEYTFVAEEDGAYVEKWPRMWIRR